MYRSCTCVVVVRMKDTSLCCMYNTLRFRLGRKLCPSISEVNIADHLVGSACRASPHNFRSCLQLRALAHLRNLLPQHPPHLSRQPHAFLVVQLISLPASKHGPTPALDLRFRLRPGDDVEVNMRHDLCCSCACSMLDPSSPDTR